MPRRQPPAHRRLHAEPLEPRRLLSGQGLTAQYFHNTNFTGLAGERTEAVDFLWTASPLPGLDGNTFSVRWFGQVEAQYTETYAFRTFNDDGVRLWVDGKLLIDDWAVGAAAANTGTIDLVAGQRYDVRLEYFDNTGSAEVRLQWQSASQPLQIIPATQLYASPEGVLGEYRDSFGGQGTRVDPNIDFNWGTGRPISTVAVDSFNARWTGYLRPEHSESYTFALTSDEGVRLWIGDELVIDHWTPHTTSTMTGSKTLEAGKWYDFRVEYFDASGTARVHLNWASPSQTGGLFEVIGSQHLRAAHDAPLLATNPLGQGQDPFVIQYNGTYIYVRSGGGGVWLDQAEHLEDVHSTTPESASVKVWTAPSGTNYSSQIWAPELFQLNGKWYIYVAASDGNNATHRMHVLERDNPNPMGPFTYKGQITDSTDRWAIDGTVLEWQDQLYFIWSGWPGGTNGVQNLYIAPMSNPWTISGPRTLLSTPEYSWEKHGLWINEGPQILINNGQLHVIYSASGYWTHEYALGRLTYDGVGPITDASSWTKASQPVFKQAGDVVGVGHASFVKSPDGSQDWIVYHSHPSPDGDPDQRVVRIQQFTWNANGTPNFGAPLPSTTPVEVPSGYADPDRPHLPGDFNANSAVNNADLTVWRDQFGAELFPGRVIDGADFLLWQRQLGATPQAAAAASSQAIALPLDGAEPANELASNEAAAPLTSASDDLVDLSQLYIVSHYAAPKTSSTSKAPSDDNAAPYDAAIAAWQPQLFSAQATALIPTAAEDEDEEANPADDLFAAGQDPANLEDLIVAEF